MWQHWFPLTSSVKASTQKLIMVKTCFFIASTYTLIWESKLSLFEFKLCFIICFVAQNLCVLGYCIFKWMFMVYYVAQNLCVFFIASKYTLIWESKLSRNEFKLCFLICIVAQNLWVLGYCIFIWMFMVCYIAQNFSAWKLYVI